MDSTKEEKAVKIEPKEEPDIKIEHQLYVIDQKIEEKPELATVRPLTVPVDSFRSYQAEPSPSSSRVVAEVRVQAPPPAPVKFEDADPFDLAPPARFSPPPPPADRAKRRSVPGGHDSARPRIKFSPYQARR